MRVRVCVCVCVCVRHLFVLCSREEEGGSGLTQPQLGQDVQQLDGALLAPGHLPVLPQEHKASLVQTLEVPLDLSPYLKNQRQDSLRTEIAG